MCRRLRSLYQCHSSRSLSLGLGESHASPAASAGFILGNKLDTTTLQRMLNSLGIAMMYPVALLKAGDRVDGNLCSSGERADAKTQGGPSHAALFGGYHTGYTVADFLCLTLGAVRQYTHLATHR